MSDLDLAVFGGMVLDGSGAPGVRADVGVAQGRVVALGDLSGAQAAVRLDAAGKVVAPGFIDIHSHSDFTILVNPAAESKARQGVTLEVNGQCGFTPFPVRPGTEDLLDALCPFITEKPAWGWVSTADYLARLGAARPAINVAQMVGHSALRAWVMGFEQRHATPDEIAVMGDAAAQALEQGAVGISLGLAYALGSFAAQDEVEALARVAAGHGALLSVHIRNEGAALVESLQEMIGIARRVSEQGPVRLQIDHLKASGRRWWGTVDEALATIEAAREEGLDVAFDVYPYIAGSRHLSGSLPAWVHDGGNEAVMRRLQDPACRDRLRREHEAWLRDEADDSPFELDLEHIIVTDVATERNRHAVGKTLVEIAGERGQDPLDATLDLLVEERGHVSIVLFSMSEDDMRTCLRHPLGCVGTDGLVFAPYGPLSRGKPHPRSYGTFPRVLGRYVREEGLLPLEEAVRKCTSLPAARLGLTDRGLLRPGMRADIVVFDPATILDTATFEDPHRHPEGIAWVIVNGVLTVDGSAHLNPGAGQVVRG